MSDPITRRIVREAREIIGSAKVCSSCGRVNPKGHKRDCWVSEWQRRANDWEVAEHLYVDAPELIRHREDASRDGCICGDINSRNCPVHA